MATPPSLEQRLAQLEQELQRVMQSLERLEKTLQEEDGKVKALQREMQREHDLINRREHGIPVGL